MGRAGDKLLDKLFDAFRVVIFGVILIIAAWGVLEQVLKDFSSPFWIKGIIYGLIVLFIYLTRDKIVEFTKTILK